jgi:hypothetical protein
MRSVTVDDGELDVAVKRGGGDRHPFHADRLHADEVSRLI